ncbi:cytochrome ubiquinol oxidase subunit I [Sphingomonas donggukensis]|uniref:Cytochrome ubiquinol oxidase subunit I n=1 Tax=Sphingomonas donggukensis TaxID=2949093 RepID=A0ABY4TQ84_9SPHN|nr:cytochrome ubiquinol oxidase subunit I [Sphingomonas donggukensis]URW74463.1 cytochrome ubiquinol oxidase subunit I [Sphingomonas donggukensis]
MESLDAIVLARAQFAFTVSFHFIFPAFSIGLASYLAVLEGLWLWTKKPVFLDLYKFWLKIFAVAFAMGVVSGIVMSYQFGTNWSVFSDKVGPVIGPLMAYEVLTAFFLEAGFLGVMLFGMKKVGPRLHFAATCCVAVGTFISAFWIISANSWMHTPTGFTTNAAGQFVVAGSWIDVIFNPSFPYRLVHTVIGAYLTTALSVGAVGAWHLLKARRGEVPHVDAGDGPEFEHSLPKGADSPPVAHDHAVHPSLQAARVMFSMAMWMLALVTPLQIAAGDAQGLNTLAHQPAKLMAMEGHFESHKDGAPLYLFGIPNQREKRLDYAVGIPKASSLILKHDPNAPLAGLDTIPDDREPPVAIVFWSFRVMVGLGFAMLGLGLWSLYARLRGKLAHWPWLHRAAVAMGPAGFVAVIAGWITTEVGRQPFTVYNLLRTTDSASPLAAPAVATSLMVFVIVYFAVFGFGTWYILKLMAKGVEVGESEPSEDVPTRTAGIAPGVAQPGVGR